MNVKKRPVAPPSFGVEVLEVRDHVRKGRGVRRHARRRPVHRHRALIGPKERLYPWGTLYECSTCGSPVIRDERKVRRFGPRRGR